MKVINQEDAIRKLDEGSPIIFATDTLPAIGCKPKYSEKIYSFKKRNKNKPLILMGSEISQVLDFVDNCAKEDFIKVGKDFWPGPLTLVIPISSKHRMPNLPPDNSLGIRIPNSLTARLLIARSGPLLTSSANISGQSTSFSAEEVSSDLPGIDILGPIPWLKLSGNASTIISWIGKGKWKLLRQGQISIQAI